MTASYPRIFWELPGSSSRGRYTLMCNRTIVAPVPLERFNFPDEIAGWRTAPPSRYHNTRGSWNFQRRRQRLRKLWETGRESVYFLLGNHTTNAMKKVLGNLCTEQEKQWLHPLTSGSVRLDRREKRILMNAGFQDDRSGGVPNLQRGSASF